MAELLGAAEDEPNQDEQAAMREKESGDDGGDMDAELMQSLKSDEYELMQQGRGAQDGPDEDEEDAMMDAFDEGVRREPERRRSEPQIPPEMPGQEPQRPPAAAEPRGNPPRSRTLTRNVVYAEALQ